MEEITSAKVLGEVKRLQVEIQQLSGENEM